MNAAIKVIINHISLLLKYRTYPFNATPPMAATDENHLSGKFTFVCGLSGESAQTTYKNEFLDKFQGLRETL
jgi:hypothetical protein